MKKGTLVITANVPLSEMFGYSTQLRSLSSGRATYVMEPAHFERVPATITLFEDGSRAIGCHNLSDTGYCLAPYMGDYGGNKYRNPPRNICPHLRPIHSAVLDRLDR